MNDSTADGRAPRRGTGALQTIDVGDTSSTRLETAECWKLLEGEKLARLAVSDAHGAPDVYPVNFVAYEGALYIRTARGSKLTRLTAHPAVALEIDGEDGESRWSVVVRGPARLLRDGSEFESSGLAQLMSWAPGEKPFAVKIMPNVVSGRRFAKKLSTAAVPPKPTSREAVRRSAGAAEASPPVPGRADSPHPIPTQPPLESFHR